MTTADTRPVVGGSKQRSDSGRAGSRALRAQHGAAVRRRSIRGRLAARGLRVLAAVLRRLPEAPLNRGADAVGGLLYRAQPARRRVVRANLERVVRYLAANGMGGDVVRLAASDAAALDRLTRSAFGHYMRSYLESATLARYAAPDHLARVRADDQAAADAALLSDEPVIIVGLHFGAIEIPGVWVTRVLGRRVTAPMETVADPDIQGYFQDTRGVTGLNVIPVERAASELRAALARKEAIALVADRPVGGTGTPVNLFGAPARLPLGPAILAQESGAPAWLIATRRAGKNEYRSRIERIEVPASPPGAAESRRERASAFLDAEARAFERAVADAPDQWWTLFFPIWDDIPAAEQK